MTAPADRRCVFRAQLLQRNVDCELDPASWLTVTDHLRICQDCSAEYEGLAELKKILACKGIRYRAPAGLRARVTASLGVCAETSAADLAPGSTQINARSRRGRHARSAVWRHGGACPCG